MVRSGRNGSSDVICAFIAARCAVMSERSPYTGQVQSKSGKRNKLVSARVALITVHLINKLNVFILITIFVNLLMYS